MSTDSLIAPQSLLGMEGQGLGRKLLSQLLQLAVKAAMLLASWEGAGQGCVLLRFWSAGCKLDLSGTRNLKL